MPTNVVYIQECTYTEINFCLRCLIYKTFQTVSSYSMWMSRGSRGGRAHQGKRRIRRWWCVECWRWKEQPKRMFCCQIQSRDPVMDGRWLLLKDSRVSSLAWQLTKAMLLINLLISVSALNARRIRKTGIPSSLMYGDWLLHHVPYPSGLNWQWQSYIKSH